MIPIPGYQITETVRDGQKTMVCRARRLADQQTVILKLLKNRYPPPEEIAQFEHEYEISRALNITGIVKPRQFLKSGNNLVLIFDSFNGITLKKQVAEQPFDLASFFPVAIQLADTLGQLHQQGLIHRDIKPSNILINRTTGQVKITDFSISVRHDEVTEPAQRLTGTLAYLSPEQTGRLNQRVDYRTDLYALGATFHELLAGQPPFTLTDPLELIHAHIAKPPPPLTGIQPTVPPMLSAIIMKLLAKNVADRYQSAAGLKADLVEAAQQWRAKGQIESFPLAQQDVTHRLPLPAKLYGRQREINFLRERLARLQTADDPLAAEMLLVTGYAGSGKTSVVKTALGALTSGYFISGKFDQFQQDIPYSAVVKAFADLVRQLLTESRDRLAEWRAKLLQAVEPNGQVIVDVIPEIELIIGPQPPVQALGLAETKNRFQLVFQNFVRVCCEPTQPLIIFLDDLQWVDAASLQVIEMMLTDDHIQALWLIGAYREPELPPDHPLTVTLQTLEQHCPMSRLALQPLELNQVTALIADTLACEVAEVQPLAEVVMSKTQGNPFFVGQFLEMLHQEKWLTVQPMTEAGETGSWQWDIERLKALEITDNVITLMTNRVEKLPPETQEALAGAACLGNQFELSRLALICDMEMAELLHHLRPALSEGLIVPLYDWVERHSTYCFLHDQVQQATYNLLPESAKPALHLQIGRLLKAQIHLEARSAHLFEVVDHLNLGRDLITEATEQRDLAHFNLLAGQAAKNSMAYVAAQHYLTVGLELLTATGDIWQQSYELAMGLHVEQAEVACLTGHFQLTEDLIALTLQQARSPLEQAKLYNMLIIHRTMWAEYEAALQAGQQALALLEIELPLAVEAELAEVTTRLGEQPITSRLTVETTPPPAPAIAIKVLTDMQPAAYLAQSPWFPMTVLRPVNLCLQYGHLPEAAKSYATYGMFLASRLGQYHLGYQFVELGIQLSQQFNDLAQQCRAKGTLLGHVGHWVTPLPLLAEIGEQAYQLALQAGDVQYAGYILMFRVINWFHQGKPLTDLATELESLSELVQRTKNQIAIDLLEGYRLTIAALVEESESELRGRLNIINEEDYLSQCETRHSYLSLGIYNLLKAQRLYLLGQPASALEWLYQATEYLTFMSGLFPVAEHTIYHSLIMLAVYPNVSVDRQQEYLLRVAVNQRQLKQWADHCPANFEPPYRLVEAERLHIKGDFLAAMRAYHQAIAAAQQYERRPIIALAQELTAQFYAQYGFTEQATRHWQEAHYAYLLWGANHKVAELVAAHPFLATHSETTDSASKMSHTVSTETAVSLIDVSAMMKASQAISGEIVLDKLLERLMKILIEDAGAQRGVLVLARQGELFVEAEGRLDPEIVTTVQSVNISEMTSLPQAILNYVWRTQEMVVLAEATEAEARFASDAYILDQQPRSILCLPIIKQTRGLGVVYLENNLTAGAFTPDRIEVIKLLSAQAAISLENATLYATMRQEINERKRAEATLHQQKEQLGQLNQQLADYSQNLEQKVTKRTYEIEQRRQVAESLRGMLTVLNSNRPLAEILKYILQEACRFLGTDSVAIFRLEADQSRLVVQAAQGMPTDWPADFCLPVEQTFLGQAIRQREPVVVSDIHLTEDAAMGALPPEQAKLFQRHYQTLLAVPLIRQGIAPAVAEVYGGLTLCYPQSRQFSGDELALAVAFADQATLAIQNARLRHQVEQAAVMEERGRLARELHDSVTQSLYSLTLLSEGWRRLAKSGRLTDLEEPLIELGGIGQQALKEMRLLVHQLRPPELEAVGLLEALHQRLAAVERRAGVEARLLADDETLELPQSVEEGLYRIAQEALNNALKHAAATTVTIYLRTENQQVALEVTDDGQGFEPAATNGLGGIGLSSMRERTERLGGCLTIDSAPGDGTTITVTVAL